MNETEKLIETLKNQIEILKQEINDKETILYNLVSSPDDSEEVEN